jgi:hypothetical protein
MLRRHVEAWHAEKACNSRKDLAACRSVAAWWSRENFELGYSSKKYDLETKFPPLAGMPKAWKFEKGLGSLGKLELVASAKKPQDGVCAFGWQG